MYPTCFTSDSARFGRFAVGIIAGVADDVRQYLRRFQQRSDVDLSDQSFGPHMLVAFHADGHGSSYRASFTLTDFPTEYDEAPTVVVKANELVTVPVPVRAERLFMNIETSGLGGFGELDGDGGHSSNEDARSTPLTFAEFARADANADGFISADELRETSNVPQYFWLQRRAGLILAPAP